MCIRDRARSLPGKPGPGIPESYRGLTPYLWGFGLNPQSPTDAEAAALRADLGRQMRIDLIDQYVSGLRTHYGYTVDEKRLVEALGNPQEVVN